MYIEYKFLKIPEKYLDAVSAMIAEYLFGWTDLEEVIVFDDEVIWYGVDVSTGLRSPVHSYHNVTDIRVFILEMAKKGLEVDIGSCLYLYPERFRYLSTVTKIRKKTKGPVILAERYGDVLTLTLLEAILCSLGHENELETLRRNYNL